MRKIELDIASAKQQIEELQSSWRQRWAGEEAQLREDRDRLWSVSKEDRDRAWVLFTSYLVALFAVGGVLWGGLMWWIRWQKKDLDKTISQLPILEANVRNFILKISEIWPETESTLDGLKLRARLDGVRHQVIIEYVRELNNAAGAITKVSAKARMSEALSILDKYTTEITNNMHLLSGSRRYVKQAVNLLEDGENIPTLTRKLLPLLCEIYSALDPELGATVAGLTKSAGVTQDANR